MTRLHLDIQALRGRIGLLQAAYPEVFDDPEWLNDTLEGETDFHAIMTRLVDERQEADSMVAAVKERAKNLAERQARFATKSSKISEIMLGLMQSAGLKNLPLPEATIAVRDGVQSVQIVDENLLTGTYLRTKTEPDKTAIKEALKAGQEVPGATLSNGGPSIQVKVK